MGEAVSGRGRYFELVDLAECGPDSPWIHYPDDRPRQVDWLWARLADRGHLVERHEVEAAMDAAFPRGDRQ